MNFFGQSHINIGMKRLSQIKLRHLEIFMEVAQRSSVSRAAESLNLTQPAVTRTVRELERVCGKPLVAKDGRGIRITPEGELFLRHAVRSVVAARSGLSALDHLSSDVSPKIRIGALPTVSASVMPDIVSAFLGSGARNQLVVVTGENRILLDQLRRGELDLVVGRLAAPEYMQGLIFQHLYREQVVVVVHKEHPLAERTHISPIEFGRYPLVMPTRTSIIRPFVDRMFIELGFAQLVPPIESVSDSFGRAFVRRHRAIWVISHGVVATEIASGEFRKLPIDTASTLGSVGIAMRADGELPSGAELFVEFVRTIKTADDA
jgi:LysR family pca operon transcriptional activator